MTAANEKIQDGGGLYMWTVTLRLQTHFLQSYQQHSAFYSSFTAISNAPVF